MHKSRLAALVIDSRVDNVDAAADFWSSALGYDVIPSKADWASRYAHLKVGKGDLRVLVQKVEHPSRVHLDIETDNIPAEVKRLEALGATVVEDKKSWTVMQAPTGHRFCVVAPQRPDFKTANDVNTWD